ncbi:hypothetical protein BVY10_11550 [Pseudomonas amygdali pv. morsprunorum]|nr:hypothetical protein BVY10_11550 [Pseudomonas amygdali pv. morsprunorum]
MTEISGIPAYNPRMQVVTLDVSRIPKCKMHERVIALKSGGCSIADTARLARVSVSQVKRVWSQYLAAKPDV